MVLIVGNQIHLAGEARDPEAVIGIRRRHGQIGRRAAARGSLTGICSSLAVTMPKLEDNDIPTKIDGRSRVTSSALDRLGSHLGGKDHARRGQEKNDHDEDGNHSPGELDLIAAIDLRRFLRECPDRLRASGSELVRKPAGRPPPGKLRQRCSAPSWTDRRLNARMCRRVRRCWSDCRQKRIGAIPLRPGKLN